MSGTLFDQTTDTDAPEPGIYTGVPFEEYASWPLVNASALKWGRLSMKHLKAAVDGHMSKDTPDRKLGRDIHTRLLEPERFAEEYVVAGTCTVPIKSGAREGQPCGNSGTKLVDGEWRCGTHGKGYPPPEAEIVSESDARKLDAIDQAVKAHPAVRLLRSYGGCEVSIVFDYPVTFSIKQVVDGEEKYDLHRTSVRMKARLDKLIDQPLTIVDLKKTQVGKITLHDLQGAVTNYSYHIQAHIYCEAVRSLRDQMPAFMWVFVEDAPPHDVAVMQADAETLRIGKTETESLLERYAKCRHTDIWPGVSNEIETGGLRQSYKDRMTKEL